MIHTVIEINVVVMPDRGQTSIMICSVILEQRAVSVVVRHPDTLIRFAGRFAPFNSALPH